MSFQPLPAPNTSRNAAIALIGVLLLCAASIFVGNTLNRDLALETFWPGYSALIENLHHPASWWRWVLGDISEVAFYKHEFASIGLLAGAALGWWANRTGKRWQGFAICYGTGLWPSLVTSSLLGLLLSNLLWGWTVTADNWQPTFAAFVSLPAAMVLLFGGCPKVVINGAILGALLVTPACLLIVNYVCAPLALPAVIGNVAGMAVASVVAFTLCKSLPVLVRSSAPVQAAPPPAALDRKHGFTWGMRRVLADFSEAPFFGNEWASLGLILGAVLAYALNPASPFYGSGWLLELLAGQAFASAVGIVVWRRRWISKGWYPTYIPVVSVVPAAILVHGASLPVIAMSAIFGGLIAPPLAAAISARLPSHMHGYIGNVTSMALSTLLILPLIGWVISTL